MKANPAGIPLLTLLLFVFGSVLVILLMAYLGYLVRRFWQRLDQLEIKERFAIKNDFIKTLAQVLGGAFFLVSIFFTYQSLVVSQKNLAATQERNITDLFTKAIEQLGSDKLQVRLGGISALRRIGLESKNDRGPIIGVLTAYVRTHAPAPDLSGEPAGAQKPAEKPKKATRQETEMAGGKKRPKNDIQAVLGVLSQLSVQSSKDMGYQIIADLSETDLRGADLRGLKLAANFPRARLDRADFSGADMNFANFEGASLEGANLAHADFRFAHNLDKEQLRQTRNWVLAFLPPDIQKKLGLPKNHNQRLAKQDLSFYNFAGWDLRNAVFSENLKGVNFRGANLEKAFFYSVNLEGAILEKADLKGADLHYVHTLTREQLASAIIDKNTKLPDYLKNPHSEKPQSK